MAPPAGGPCYLKPHHSAGLSPTRAPRTAAKLHSIAREHSAEHTPSCCSGRAKLQRDVADMCNPMLPCWVSLVAPGCCARAREGCRRRQSRWRRFAAPHQAPELVLWVVDVALSRVEADGVPAASSSPSCGTGRGVSARLPARRLPLRPSTVTPRERGEPVTGDYGHPPTSIVRRRSPSASRSPRRHYPGQAPAASVPSSALSARCPSSRVCADAT